MSGSLHRPIYVIVVVLLQLLTGSGCHGMLRTYGRVGPPISCCEIKLIPWEEGGYLSREAPHSLAHPILSNGTNGTKGSEGGQSAVGEVFRDSFFFARSSSGEHLFHAYFHEKSLENDEKAKKNDDIGMVLFVSNFSFFSVKCRISQSDSPLSKHHQFWHPTPSSYPYFPVLGKVGGAINCNPVRFPRF